MKVANSISKKSRNNCISLKDKGIGNKRVTLKAYYNYFIVFLAILFTGKASFITSTIDFRINPVGGGLFLLGIVVMLSRNWMRYLSKKAIFSFFCILITWTTLQFAFGTGYDFVILYNIFAHSIFACLLIGTMGISMIPMAERIITSLSLIDLFLWICVVVLGIPFFSNISLLTPAAPTITSASFLIFNVTSITDNAILPRNCGFAWEPGRFASIVCLAIVFNIYRHKGKLTLRKNKNLIILLASLLSSFSTTGYVCFICVLIYTLFVHYKSKFILPFYIVVLPTLIYSFYNIDFLATKIIETMNPEEFVVNTGDVDTVEQLEMVYTPQRFECMMLQGMNFLNDFLIGFGTGPSYTTRNISPNISISTGIFAMLAQFGIFIGIIFCYAYIKSSYLLGKHYNSPTYLFLVCYLCISVSYSFIYSPLVLSVILLSLLYKNNKNYDKKTATILNNHGLPK